MIQALRRNLKALSVTLWLVVIAFIGTTFLVWGRGSITGSDSTAVATVNGEEILLDRYQRLYRSYSEFYRQLYRERFTPAVADRLGISQQVIDSLIEETLILQSARAEGMQVGDEEVRAKIQGIRGFQENGRFSRERYLRILGRARIDPATFEAEQRRDLLRGKVEAAVKAGIKVSDTELRQAYEFRHGKVQAAWTKVAIVPLMAELTPTESELKEYLTAHSLEFQEPARRRLQYVVVSPKTLARPVTGAEVKTYYEEHASEFERPRRVKAAHVLVRVAEVGGSAAEDEARAKVEAVIRRARGGEDFAKLAQEISEDAASASAGGELGYVARGELVSGFEQALFALKKGETSPEPVRTPFGYHAIKALEIDEGGRRPLKEVAGQIRKKIQAETSDRAALAKAEEVQEPLRSAQDFLSEARKLGLQPTTALMARGESLAEIGRVESVEDTVFSLALGGVTTPLKTPAGYTIVKVLKELPAAVPPFADIKEKVAAAVKRQRATGLAQDRARALAKTVTGGGDLVTAAKKQGLQAGTTGFFSRAEPAEERLPGDVMRIALESTVGEISEPIAAPDGIFLVQALARRVADSAGLDKDRDRIRREILERKRARAWESWVGSLRAGAEIQVSAGLSSGTP